jgi:hypothetical protein
MLSVLLGLSLLLAAAPNANAASDDIESINSAYQLIVAEIDGNQENLHRKLVAQLTSMVMKHAVNDAIDGRYDSAARLTDGYFEEQVVFWLNGLVSNAGGVKGPIHQRMEAYENILHQASARSQAGRLVAKYLDMPEPGSFLEDVKPAHPRASVQSYTYSRSSEIAINAESLKIEEEIGGTGEGNKIFDAGEWFKISFEVINIGDTPYFSSSAWLESADDSCLWVADATEKPMLELPVDMERDNPEREEAQVGYPLEVWGYLSSQCQNDRVAKLKVIVRDTHRTRGDDISLWLDLTVKNVNAGGPGRLFFDQDVPGSSDDEGYENSSPAIVWPELDFELSHSFTATREAVEARQAWGLSDDLEKLVTRKDAHSYDQTVPMMSLGEGTGRFEQSDDLDLRAKGDDSYHKVVAKAAARQEWMAPAPLDVWNAGNPRPWDTENLPPWNIENQCLGLYDLEEWPEVFMWAATDISVDYPSPDPGEVIDEEEPELTRVKPDDAFSLIKDKFKLEERHVPTISADSVEAVAGYVLRSDKENAIRLLVCAEQGISEKECNQCTDAGLSTDYWSECWTCKEDKKTAKQCAAEKGEVKETPDDRGQVVQYKFRQYYPIAVCRQNQCPKAAVTQSRFYLKELETITVDASRSTDADIDELTDTGIGQTLTYTWRIKEGPMGHNASLEYTSNVKAEFSPDLRGKYVLEVTVSDGACDRTTQVSVNIAPKQAGYLALGAGYGLGGFVDTPSGSHIWEHPDERSLYPLLSVRFGIWKERAGVSVSPFRLVAAANLALRHTLLYQVETDASGWYEEESVALGIGYELLKNRNFELVAHAMMGTIHREVEAALYIDQDADSFALLDGFASQSVAMTDVGITPTLVLFDRLGLYGAANFIISKPMTIGGYEVKKAITPMLSAGAQVRF